jgi:hypothetical protein
MGYFANEDDNDNTQYRITKSFKRFIGYIEKSIYDLTWSRLCNLPIWYTQAKDVEGSGCGLIWDNALISSGVCDKSYPLYRLTTIAFPWENVSEVPIPIN